MSFSYKIDYHSLMTKFGTCIWLKQIYLLPCLAQIFAVHAELCNAMLYSVKKYLFEVKST